jgi:uncharacterized protein (DUF1015 family)
VHILSIQRLVLSSPSLPSTLYRNLLTFARPYGNTFPVTDPFLSPFRGILLNPENIDNVARCVCPPYDVISNIRAYYERDKYNVIRLELPMATPNLDPYSAAKGTLEEWLGAGVLVQDPKDTIYLYDQEFVLDGTSYRRKGIISLVRLDRQKILIHEATKKKAKEDRERLLTTTKTFTSIIFGLYEDRDRTIEAILDGSEQEVIYDFVDEQSIRNRFLRMTKTSEITALSGLMEERSVYIADGHHRFDVSCRLGLSYAPFYITNMYSEGIVILPYHRTVAFVRPRPVGELINAIKEFVEIEQYPADGDNDLKHVLASIARSPSPAFAFFAKDDSRHFYVARQSAVIPQEGKTDEALARLKVNIIHSGVLKGLLKISDDEISFTHEAEKAVNDVREGAADLAILVPPTDVEEVKAVADKGLIMPPKSTFFFPKVLTGLVFHKYA